jgi:hypothetical protein
VCVSIASLHTRARPARAGVVVIEDELVGCSEPDTPAPTVQQPWAVSSGPAGVFGLKAVGAGDVDSIGDTLFPAADRTPETKSRSEAALGFDAPALARVHVLNPNMGVVDPTQPVISSRDVPGFGGITRQGEGKGLLIVGEEPKVSPSPLLLAIVDPRHPVAGDRGGVPGDGPRVRHSSF